MPSRGTYSRWNLLGTVATLTFLLFALRMGWTALMAWWSGRNGASGRDAPRTVVLTLITVLCGVRGSLGLSATLSIPLLTAAGTAMPGRDLAVFLAAATIAATLLISGVVMPLLRLEPDGSETAQLSFRGVQLAIARVALRVIEDERLTAVSSKVREWAATWKRLYESRIAALDGADDRTGGPHRRDLAAQRALSMHVLRAQRRELARLHDAGAVGHAILQAVEFELDLAEIALSKLDLREAEA